MSGSNPIHRWGYVLGVVEFLVTEADLDRAGYMSGGVYYLEGVEERRSVVISLETDISRSEWFYPLNVVGGNPSHPETLPRS